MCIVNQGASNVDIMYGSAKGQLDSHVAAEKANTAAHDRKPHLTLPHVRMYVLVMSQEQGCLLCC